MSQSADTTVAARVVDEILDVCSALQTMPRLGKARNELAKGVRSITSGSYVIYYRISNKSCDILRIWHAHRDIAALKNEF